MKEWQTVFNQIKEVKLVCSSISNSMKIHLKYETKKV